MSRFGTNSAPDEPHMRRWVVFRRYAGESKQHIDFIEELEELADLVEAGPDWNTLSHIRIELNQLRRSI